MEGGLSREKRKGSALTPVTCSRWSLHFDYLCATHGVLNLSIMRGSHNLLRVRDLMELGSMFLNGPRHFIKLLFHILDEFKLCAGAVEVLILPVYLIVHVTLQVID